MSAFSDFGSNYPSGPLWIPQLFAFAASDGSFAAEASSGPVPEDQTWVLLGVDAAGSGTGPITLAATFLTGGGDNIWYGTASAPYEFAYGLTDTTPVAVNQCGVSWRGAIPYTVGTGIEAVADVTGAGDYASVTCWGVILPYLV